MADLNQEDETVKTDGSETLAAIQAAVLGDAVCVADWAGRTHVGHVRNDNQDRWDHVDDRFFVIADGMGGQAGGELAAQLVVDQLVERFGSESLDHLERSLSEINQIVVAAGVEAGTERLGSTALFAVPGIINTLIVSVGDSRAYRVTSSGVVEQLTVDHTVRAEVIGSGADPQPLLDQGIRLDALTSFIGREAGPASVFVDSTSFHAGDRLVLASDGVYRPLGAAGLSELSRDTTAAGAADRAIEMALDGGGRDNATVVVVEFRSAK